ncbi:MAG: RNA methyltransferase [Cyanobium sp.]
MSLPDQLLLSDLLSRRVRCDRGLEHGSGQEGWMHPPVHRLLGWVSRPSALSNHRCVWRLDQLRALVEGEVLVQGDPSDVDVGTLERLPTLLGAILLSGRGEPLGQLADAAFEPRSGRILHYLVARSDPRLPGGSRWRLAPDRITDQRAGEVSTALEGLRDLPLARASLRESLLRRSRRWRDQWDEETGRLREQWQQASGRFEDRLEGWLEEPPWDGPRRSRPQPDQDREVWPREDRPEESSSRAGPVPSRSGDREVWPEDEPAPEDPRRREFRERQATRRAPDPLDEDDDPWV